MSQSQPNPTTKKQRKEIKKPDPVELDEDASTADAVRAFNKYTQELNAYHEAKLAETKTEIEEKQQATATKSEKDKIDSFLAKQEHATNPDVWKKMELLYRGGADIESAYADAVSLVLGADKATGKEAKEEEAKVTTLSESDGADGTETETIKEKKPKTIRDVAKKNLDRILSEDPEAKKMFEEME